MKWQRTMHIAYSEKLCQISMNGLLLILQIILLGDPFFANFFSSFVGVGFSVLVYDDDDINHNNDA